MTEFMKFQVPVVAEVIRDLGYKAKVHEMEKSFFIESATSGMRLYLYCWPDTTDEKNIDADISLIRFRAGWYELVDFNETEIDALCNWYNANQPFTKLYRRNDETSFDLILEADLYVMDGMSAEAFANRFNRFIGQLEYANRCFRQCRYTSKSEIMERHNKAVEILQSFSPDVDEAVGLYRQNAHLGYAGSQNNFGDLFEKGSGVPKDDLMAVYWYTRASERGEPTAYYSLASILEASRSNADSLTVAAKYAILASDQLPEGRNKFASMQLRDSLKELLDPKFYDFAEELAARFKPIYEEKWIMGDAPGGSIFTTNGSNSLN